MSGRVAQRTARSVSVCALPRVPLGRRVARRGPWQVRAREQAEQIARLGRAERHCPRGWVARRRSATHPPAFVCLEPVSADAPMRSGERCDALGLRVSGARASPACEALAAAAAAHWRVGGSGPSAEADVQAAVCRGGCRRRLREAFRALEAGGCVTSPAAATETSAESLLRALEELCDDGIVILSASSAPAAAAAAAARAAAAVAGMVGVALALAAGVLVGDSGWDF